jgi:hypothetical protein
MYLLCIYARVGSGCQQKIKNFDKIIREPSSFKRKHLHLNSLRSVVLIHTAIWPAVLPAFRLLLLSNFPVRHFLRIVTLLFTTTPKLSHATDDRRLTTDRSML